MYASCCREISMTKVESLGMLSTKFNGIHIYRIEIQMTHKIICCFERNGSYRNISTNCFLK